MSDLHDQLREIILRFGMGMYVSEPDSDTFTPVRWEESPLVDEIMEEIEQVYKEAGYVKPEPNQAVIIPQKLHPLTYMPNGEYLTRFRTELDAEKPYMSPGEYKHALAAAERAAGIK